MHDLFEAREPTNDRPSGAACLFTHPDEVLGSPALSIDDKRAVLAAWASDAHAVPDQPAMRRLDSGALVPIDAILDALRALDGAGPAKRSGPAAPGRDMILRSARVWRWPRLHRRDDDDDPPPCPARALPPGVELALRHRRDRAWTLAA